MFLSRSTSTIPSLASQISLFCTEDNFAESLTYLDQVNGS